MKLKKINGKIVSVVAKNNIDWNKIISKPQFLVKKFLESFWKNDSVVEEFHIPGSRMRIDFFNFSKRIAIEVNPDNYHVNYNNFLHKNKLNFLEKVKSDEKKRIWCQSNDIKFAELYDEDIDSLSENLFKTKYNILL